MSDRLDKVISGNPVLTRLIVYMSVILGWLATDLLMQQIQQARHLTLITTYLLPAFGGVTLFLVHRLGRQAGEPIGRRVALVGLAFIIGGALVDLTATVWVSPDLSMEGNPFVRVLLDSGHSLPMVYWHSFITQLVFIVLFCECWLAALRHMPVLIESIESARPRTLVTFLKAATGGAHLTIRQWLLPLRRSEMPMLYHSVWAVAVAIVFGVSLFRWYAALEWVNVVSPSSHLRVLVVTGGVTVSLAGYFVALWCVYRTSNGYAMAQQGHSQRS